MAWHRCHVRQPRRWGPTSPSAQAKAPCLWVSFIVAIPALSLCLESSSCFNICLSSAGQHCGKAPWVVPSTPNMKLSHHFRFSGPFINRAQSSGADHLRADEPYIEFKADLWNPPPPSLVPANRWSSLKPRSYQP